MTTAGPGIAPDADVLQPEPLLPDVNDTLCLSVRKDKRVLFAGVARYALST